MEDHVHVFLSAPPKVAPAIIAKILKGSTARTLFTKHPDLKNILRSGHLWNPSYYVGSAGHVSSEIIHDTWMNKKQNRKEVNEEILILTIKAKIHTDPKTEAVLKDAMFCATKVYNGLLWHLRKEYEEKGKVKVSRT